jgi:hypothetical protein
MKYACLLMVYVLYNPGFGQDGNNLYAAGNEEMRKGNYMQAESLYKSAIARTRSTGPFTHNSDFAFTNRENTFRPIRFSHM